jgi:phosphoenolpyruvate carboxylase
MATQHPDNACKTYFNNSRFVSAQDEIEECFRCFSDLNITEYMWDWEGKFVDEAVIDRLFMKYTEYFQKHPLGKDNFLTFRIPNIWIESSHKLPRAFMNILTAENAAQKYGFHTPPLFEVILPMASSLEQLVYLQESFAKISKSTEEIFEFKSNLGLVEIIPLFEEFETIANSKQILLDYVKFLKETYDFTPPYLRVMTARSDPALNAGFLPAKFAAKVAVSLYHEFEEETGIPIYSIVGGGCLPFRGGINPENIDAAIEEYAGFSTLTVQSAFRYDYSQEQVKEAIEKVQKKLPEVRTKGVFMSPTEVESINQLNRKISPLYKKSVESFAVLINQVSDKLPSHRERVQHIGLFGYSRGDGKVKLPRAIKFCGALYSLGVPPELLGSGQALRLAQQAGLLPLIEKICPFLREDFIHAGHYLNIENLHLLAKQNPDWNVVLEEISLIEEILDIKIGPDMPHHIIHRNLTSNIFQKLQIDQDFSDDVLAAAEIRKSLG